MHLYGAAGHNLGDDAIALAAAHEIASRLPHAAIRVASVAGPAFTRRYGLPSLALNRRSPIGMLRLVDSVRRADVVLLGGGTLVQDRLGLSRFRGILAYARQVAALAKAFGKPLGTLAIGVDELSTPRGREYARDLLALVDALVVRDERSLELARSYAGARPVDGVAAADPAYLLRHHPAAVAAASRPSPHGAYAVVSLANEGMEFGPLLPELTSAVRRLVERHGVDKVLLVAMDTRPGEELAVFRRWLASAPEVSRWAQAVTPRDAFEAHDLVSRARCVVAMRLHAMIFALGRAPLVGISRTTKTDSLLRSAGVRGLGFAEASSGARLAELVDEVMADSRALAVQAEHRGEQEDLARQGIARLVEELTVGRSAAVVEAGASG